MIIHHLDTNVLLCSHLPPLLGIGHHILTCPIDTNVLLFSHLPPLLNHHLLGPWIQTLHLFTPASSSESSSSVSMDSDSASLSHKDFGHFFKHSYLVLEESSSWHEEMQSFLARHL